MTREQAINSMISHGFKVEQVGEIIKAVTPQFSSELEKNSKKLEKPQTFKWCTDCKEYDQEKHCCHRWSKVIRDTVEEMRQEQEPCEDTISRKSIKHKLQEHHDFFVNAYGGFSNLPLNDKSRVDEITNCIAMVVNEPPVTPQELFINKPCVSSEVCEHDKNKVLDKIRVEIEQNAYPIVHGINNHELGMTLYGILQVIDKYKAESEVDNGNVDN